LKLFGFEALQTDRGFDQRAIDREVLVAQHSRSVRLPNDGIQALLRDLVPQQPLPILRKRRTVKDRLESLSMARNQRYGRWYF